MIDFSIGDPREPTPPFIPEAMKAAVPEVSQYPTVAGIAALRSTFAGYLQRRFAVDVNPATQMIPTSGSKEAIFTTPFGLVDAAGGDAVGFGTPAYPVYERGTRFAGAEAIGIPLQGDFVLRAADVPADAWDRLRILWICTPHNPTGSVTGLDDMADLVDACRAHGVLLASDECYADLYEGDPPPSVLQVSGPDFAGTLSYFSLSKRSGMTGYRSGMIAGDAEAIAALKQLRASVGVAPAEYVQAAAAAAWADDEHARERREIFAAKRAVLRAPFDEQGFEVVGSEAGLYLWVDIRGDEAEAAKRLLQRRCGGIARFGIRSRGRGVPALCAGADAGGVRRGRGGSESVFDRDLIDRAYDDHSLLQEAASDVEAAIAALDRGEERVACKGDDGWVVDQTVKRAIMLYFRLRGLDTMVAGPFEYHDKIPTKQGLAAQGIRVVPPGTVRYGAFCEPGVVVMPGYVNIGAYVGAGTMVDTWATVGSCAQIGRDVHLSGGVGIGGVLEPPGAVPVIVEDGAFIGSRCILVEGVIVEEGAVLGANTVVTSSTKIIDVTGDEPVEFKGRIPARSVVIPGTRPREFPAGTYHIPAALIIGRRSAATDEKTSLNDALRTFEVPV